MNTPALVIPFLCLCLLVVAPTLLSAIPGKHWVLRVCDFPRAQLLWLGLLLLVGAGMIAVFAEEPYLGGWGAAFRAGSIVLGLSMLVQLRWAVRLTPLFPREIARSEKHQDRYHQGHPEIPPEAALRILAANVDYENPDRERAVKRLTHWRPHLLALVETDPAWEPLIESLRDAYPWSVPVYLDEGRGMTLLSRLPIESSCVRYLVQKDRPSIWAEVGLPGCGCLRVVVLHPTPPGLPVRGGADRASSRPRDIELDLAASIIGDHPQSTWVLAGDFNDVGWSATTLRAKRVSGLGDPRVGRGMYSTFPAHWPLLRYPIDHMLVSRSVRLHSIMRLDPIGSDHLPLLADFELTHGVHAPAGPEDHLVFNPCRGETKSVSTTMHHPH